MVEPVRVQPPAKREASPDTPTLPGASPIASKPITSRGTIGDAANRSIFSPVRTPVSKSPTEDVSRSAVGVEQKNATDRTVAGARGPLVARAGADNRTIDREVQRTPKQISSPVGKDNSPVGVRPAPENKTSRDPRTVDAQRITPREGGSEISRRSRDVPGTGPAGVDPRTKTDSPPIRREMDAGRSLQIRHTENNTNINRTSNSTVYTDNSVNIYGNNNVYISGSVSGHYPTPYGVHRYHTVVHRRHLYGSSSWLNCGGYFVLNWSRPSCGRVIGLYYTLYYSYGLSYYYPSYHRKYVFYSVGGYWPDYYRYRRYYWYGCHPYRWYGSYVIEQPVVQNVYNVTYTTPAPVGASYNYDYYYDPATEDFGDVREKLRREAAAGAEDNPMAETSADMCFEQAVDLFAKGKYEQAVFKLRVAMILEPDDVVLPFAYLQALFAAGDYDSAAAALRTTLASAPEDQEQETVYYPRGLYEDEKILQAQIAALAEAVRKNPQDADYQLLLGYQLLGSGRVDEAITPLHNSLEMSITNAPAMTLIKLLEQIKADQAAAVEAAAAAQAQPLEVSTDAGAVQPQAAKKEDE